MSSKRTVGLVARKGAGKDTAATVLIENHGFTNVKFAGALKGMIRFFLAYQGVDEQTIERMIEGDLKEVPTPFLGGRTPRYAMQTLGTEWGRDLIDENLWLNATKNKVETVAGNVVITDVRFPNEARGVMDIGGILVGIVADWIVPVEGEHPSEKKIDEVIAGLPDGFVLPNRRATGSTISKAIAELRERFVRVVGL